jgi:hypothetical protein
VADNDGTESGSSLRDKLEAEIAARRDLESQLSSYKAKDLIAEKGWQHVNPDDLKGVGLAELETKGAELEASKAALKESVLKEVLSKQGITGDDLNDAVSKLVGKVASPADDTTAALARMRAAQSAAGSPVGKLETPGVFGASRIRAALGD